MKSSSLAVVTLLLLLGSCGVAGPAPPSSEELRAGLQSTMSLLEQGRFGVARTAIVVDGHVGACREGTRREHDVIVCDYCAIVLTDNHVARHSVTMDTIAKLQGRATFHRAVSYDQPDVTPESGMTGVWVIEPDGISMRYLQPMGVSEEMRLRIQGEPPAIQPGDVFANLQGMMYGRGPSFSDVRGRLEGDALLRRDIVVLAGTCPTAGNPAPTAPTSPVGAAGSMNAVQPAPGTADTSPLPSAFDPAADPTATPQAVPAPSFDCRRASLPSELAICADPNLASLDATLGRAYDARRRSLDASSAIALREQQRLWINDRGTKCGADTDCLRDTIQERLAQLQ